MKYPRLEISLPKITHNTKVVVGICRKYGIEVVGVNKVSCGSFEIAQAMVNGGVEIIADSRLENLINIKDINVKKMLLRLPMISAVEEVVEYADISLNSELKTIKKISEIADRKGKVHNVVLMIDVGDLREGIFKEDDVFKIVKEIIKLKGINLLGLGTNLTCFGGVIPTEDNLGKLISLKNKIEDIYNIKLNVLSGGNSSSLHLIQKGQQIPKGINQLRLGTSLILGTIEVTNSIIQGTHRDAFRLIAEIVEIKQKPSKPIGKIVNDAFGNIPVFKDRGIRKRAICAIGKQDIDLNWMKSEDKDIIILGGSSDHLILDITDCNTNYDVGDKIIFILDYVAILKAMTSQYVNKVYLQEG
ncbi:ornithine racemase Orr [Caldisalinibacter kiritimatiensis]|uniref:Ornithine racemase n=1 Tax=Caldisalinibacter kiritimatiensis TaxID=1304284 RepID=R1AWP6_9FIRM|nr:ornithine racemase Orr [Caldisalinibacter kiritimatiensis]EOD01613.1 Ornithine racemase [Caldisalinibacter kiritimatiensis]